MFSRMMWIIVFVLLFWIVFMYFNWGKKYKTNLPVNTKIAVTRTSQINANLNKPKILIDVSKLSNKKEPLVIPINITQAAPNTVALTFDDGPSLPFTDEILEILQKNKVNATFFVLGKNALLNPDIIRKAYKNGNAIACHSITHRDLTILNSEQLKYEVLGCKKIIQDILGKAPVCFRLPYNKVNPEIQAYIESHNMRVVGTKIDSGDWKGEAKGDNIVNQTLSLIYPGYEITMHDGSSGDENRQSTIQALPILIKRIKEMGLGLSRICYP